MYHIGTLIKQQRLNLSLSWIYIQYHIICELVLSIQAVADETWFWLVQVRWTAAAVAVAFQALPVAAGMEHCFICFLSVCCCCCFFCDAKPCQNIFITWPLGVFPFALLLASVSVRSISPFHQAYKANSTIRPQVKKLKRPFILEQLIRT